MIYVPVIFLLIYLGLLYIKVKKEQRLLALQQEKFLHLQKLARQFGGRQSKSFDFDRTAFRRKVRRQTKFV